MKVFVNLIVSSGLVWMTACGSASTQPAALNSDKAPLLSTPIPEDASESPDPQSAANPPSPTAQKMVDLSREDLSLMLKIGMDQIVTAEVVPVIWPDASLGCPKTDLAYIQVMMPGFLVFLEVNGQQYIYHTDEAETVVLCKESNLPMFPVTPGDIQDGIPWVSN